MACAEGIIWKFVTESSIGDSRRRCRYLQPVAVMVLDSRVGQVERADAPLLETSKEITETVALIGKES